MTVAQWLGIAALVLVMGVVALAFRQGMKVSRQDGNPHGGLPPGAGMP